MKWILGFWFALVAGCATADSRPVAEDIVCLCNGDLGCVIVRVDDKTPRSTHKGETYYFCTSRCKETFEQAPEKWVRAARER